METSERRSTFRRMAGLVAGVGALGLLLGGVATATIPTSTTGQIAACYRVSGGALRVIDVQKKQRCVAGERLLTWGPSWVWRGAYNPKVAYAAGSVVQVNGSSYVARVAAPRGRAPAGTGTSYWGMLAAAGATGPTGPSGPKGDNGAKGDRGPAGTDLLLGERKVFAEARINSDGAVANGAASNGATITAGKTGTGTYFVTFPGFDQPGGQFSQKVQVTPISGVATTCFVAAESYGPDYYSPIIKCAGATGTLRDTEFFIQTTA